MPNARLRRMHWFRARNALLHSMAQCYQEPSGEFSLDEPLGEFFREALLGAATRLNVRIPTFGSVSETSTLTDGIQHLLTFGGEIPARRRRRRCHN